MLIPVNFSSNDYKIPLKFSIDCKNPVKFSNEDCKIPVRFSGDTCEIPVRLSLDNNPIPVVFGNFQTITIYPDSSPYEGSYEVIPSPDEQKLETANKVLLDDVTVRSIPYYDVSNTSGGSTVYIGTEIEIS